MVNNNEAYQLIGPFTQLLTMADLPLRGPIADELLAPIPNAGILFKGETIVRVDNFEKLVKETAQASVGIIELESKMVAMPGLIDAHTHICFDGSRALDYALRNAGKTYLEIAESGGGIWSTVKHTRNASIDKLAELTTMRANDLLLQGITTVEVKSGYGLSIEEELKILRAIQEAQHLTTCDLIPTCLAAHLCPKDFDGTPQAYLLEMATQLLPAIQAEKLATRVDAFVEQSAFTAEAIFLYFEKAKELSFHLTIHADQFTTSGSALAVQTGAVSADHLEASGEQEIKMLSNSKVIPVVLPGASIGLGCNFAPARKLLDAGCALVIASDYNPGSAPMGKLLTQATILSTFEKLTNAEVLAALTCRAAPALSLSDRGRLAPGALADFIVFETEDYREITYQQGRLQPIQVWKEGKKVLG